MRGWIYAGPVYAEEELDECLCPWCIADGSAAARFGATFTDDTPVPEDVPEEIVNIVTTQTPGFAGWRQEHWLYDCGDGAAFLGVVGCSELEAHSDALSDLRRRNGEDGRSSDQIDGYLQALDREGSPAACLFRCRHCGAHLAYADSA